MLAALCLTASYLFAMKSILPQPFLFMLLLPTCTLVHPRSCISLELLPSQDLLPILGQPPPDILGFICPCSTDVSVVEI